MAPSHRGGNDVIPMEMAAKIIFANCCLCTLGLVAEEGGGVAGASSACYHGNKFRQDDGNKYKDLVSLHLVPQGEEYKGTDFVLAAHTC